MKKFKGLLLLFWTMFKIGLFTFGGGYVMISIIDREIVERKKWIDSDEFLDVIAIAESTPGPLAINTATYVGYKMHGVLGSIFATLGVVLPSFIIILLISLFAEAFLSLEYVKYAFMGINACVTFLIISAGIKMIKKLKANWLNIILCVATIGCMIVFPLVGISFSTIYYILIGAGISLMLYLIPYTIKKIKQNKDKSAFKVSENAENSENKGDKDA